MDPIRGYPPTLAHHPSTSETRDARLRSFNASEDGPLDPVRKYSGRCKELPGCPLVETDF